jgi:hypothetical protein
VIARPSAPAAARCQAQAREQVAEQFGAALFAAQLVDGHLRGHAHAFVGLLACRRVALDQRHQLLARLRIAVVAEDANRLDTRVPARLGTLRETVLAQITSLARSPASASALRAASTAAREAFSADRTAC